MLYPSKNAIESSMRTYLILFLSSFLFLACDDSDLPADAFLPEANGQHGEILILMEDGLWNAPLGEAVIANLTRRAEGPYLRPEPMFSYFRKAPTELNNVNQLNRTILKFMVDHDSTYAETQILELRNYYAKNQLFLIVKDSDPNRLNDFASNRMDEIIDKVNNFETSQLTREYLRDPNQRIKELAENDFGISLSVPSQTVLKAEKENFILSKRDRSRNQLSNDATGGQGGVFWIQQGFMIWKDKVYPDSAQMTVENVLKNRDTTLKHNVPGQTRGTYMGTEYSEYYEPEGRVFEYEGHKAVEIRGLWIYEGDTFVGGGGPFVQYSILNESKNEIVTVSGYVYAPKYDKREYIREIDAILQTISVVN